MSKIYHYRQNNSFGKFTVNDALSENVYIEAESLEQANQVADSIGIYFDGCEKGIDCPCCGDRWYEPYDAIETPEELKEELTRRFNSFIFTDVLAILYFLNGTRYTIRRDGEVYNSQGYTIANLKKLFYILPDQIGK